MPISDDAQILQVPLRAEGSKSADWEKVRVSDLTALNEILRSMQEQFFKLNGRTGDAAIRSGLSVAGGVSSGGGLSGTGLTLGATGITPSNPSYAPLVESALTPVALDYAPLLGAKADLLSASPFTWTLSEHFLGGATSGAGDLGELGWMTLNGPTVGVVAAEASHPGILSVATNGIPLTGIALQSSLLQGDLSYLAFVVQNQSAFRTTLSVGFRDLASSGKNSLGAYFSYQFGGTSQTWQTTTKSSGGTLTNISSISVGDAEWVLMEIVFAPESVDFFLNRERLFRHTGASVDPATEAYIASIQEQGPNDTTVLHDRVVAAGRGADKIWT